MAGQILPIDKQTARKAKLPDDWVLVQPDYSGVYNYTISSDLSPRKIEWHVVQNRVVLIPSDALNTLSEDQKIRLFTPILRLKSDESEHMQNFVSACIHITTDGTITISENTDRQSSDIHKDCAEMNGLNRIPNLRKKGNKIEQTYIMVGFRDQLRQKAFCPCGKCTDSLAKNMTDAASIAIIPRCEPNDELPITRVQNFSQVGKGEIWSTNIGVLNRHYKLTLNAHENTSANEAKRVITSRQPWRDRVSAGMKHLQTSLENVLATKRVTTSPMQHLLAASLDPNSADNQRHELEADPSPANINNFRINEIARSYRYLRDAVEKEYIAEIPKDLKIRCGVVRMVDSDGKITFDTAIEVKGTGINAVPAVETTLAASTQRHHTRITDCWVTEMDLQDIDNGKMHTSQKEGAERLYKRKNLNKAVRDANGELLNGSMNLHYTVLNLGGLKDDQVRKLTHSFKIEDIFPSAFQGAINAAAELQPPPKAPISPPDKPRA